MTKNGREPARINGPSVVATYKTERILKGLTDLFLIRGLILLAAAALLVSLTWFVWHRVRLAGLVTLLRLVRLIRLCHVSSPDPSAGASSCAATSADRHLDWLRLWRGCPESPGQRQHQNIGEFRSTQKSNSLSPGMHQNLSAIIFHFASHFNSLQLSLLCS
jgi:hypothetical protein